MLLQVFHDPERLSAGGAAEGLLSGVEAQMRLQVPPQTEAFAAAGADVRPLPGVEAHVPTEALPQREGLGASRAGVGLLSAVEALVPTQDLPPGEGLAADAADVAPARVPQHLLQPPHAVSTGAEAADAVARVEALVVPQVFQRRRTLPALSASALHRPLGPGHRQHVHQVDPAGTSQFLVWRGQFQLHVQVVFLLRGVNPFPNPDLSWGQRAVGTGRTGGGPSAGADAGLLRLSWDGLLGPRWQRLQIDDRETNQLEFLRRNAVPRHRSDHQRLVFGCRTLGRSAWFLAVRNGFCLGFSISWTVCFTQRRLHHGHSLHHSLAGG